jgi:hypothetical protein
MRWYSGLQGYIDGVIVGHFITSNKSKIEPKPKPEPIKLINGEWEGGYSFAHFWGNCHAILGDVANGEGYQQLCHHYYLKGTHSASEVAKRIASFLKL